MTLQRTINRTRPAHRQRGAAMLLVLFAVAMAMVLGLSFINAQATSTVVAENSVKRMRARAAAESGIRLAVKYIQTNSTWRTDMPNGLWLESHQFAGGTIGIAGEDETDGDMADDVTEPVTITAIATFDGVSHKIRAVLTPESATGTGGWIAVSDKIELKGNGRIDGVGSKAVISTNKTSRDKIKIDIGAVLDGDVFVGPGGNPSTVIDNNGLITGSMSVLEAPVDIQTLPEPSLGKSVGDVKYNSGTSILSNNVHCNKFHVEQYAILQISGNVTILTDDEFRIKNDAQLELLPGASLTVYTKGKFKVDQNTRSNANTADPSRFMVYHLTNADVLVQGLSTVCYATIVAPKAEFSVKNYAEFCGSYKGKQLTVENDAVFHQDGGSGSEPGIAVSNNIVIGPGSQIMAMGTNVVLTTNSTDLKTVQINNVIDGDVYVGPGGDPASVISYGGPGEVTGTVGALSAAASMVPVAAPGGMPPSKGDVGIEVDTTFKAGQYHYSNLKIGGCTIQIQGAVTILVDSYFAMAQADLELADGASLKFYVGADMILYSNARLNANTADPYRFSIFHLNPGHTIFVNSAAELRAIVYSPGCTLHVNNGTGSKAPNSSTAADGGNSNAAHFYGRFTGANFLLEGGGRASLLDGHPAGEPSGGSDTRLQVLWDEQP